MKYSSFAYYYDEMMEDVSYETWVSKIGEYLPKGSSVLDVGCGTGNVSLGLARSGYDVTGVDLSEDMLVVASEKARTSSLGVEFVLQDMRELSGFSGYDGVVICVDSLNYLETSEEIIRTFENVHASLADGGIFVFDVHSMYKMTEVWSDYLYVDNDEDLAYIWYVSVVEDVRGAVSHELTFFRRLESGSYERIVEVHHQRTFEISDYLAWLDGVGFDVLEVSGDFREGDVASDADRVVFVARKKVDV